MFDDIFYRRRLNIGKLSNYGFVVKGESWEYSTSILNDTFSLYVSVMKDGSVDTRLIEKETDDLYVLYKTDAAGSFIGEVRSEIEKVLLDIADKCYDYSIFKTKQASQIIDYVSNTYKDELEFLWTRFPDNAIWRRNDNQKWYGAILTVSGRKLGLPTDDILEIIDLRLPKELMEQTVDHIHYFPGWHMNKKSWYTIILNETVSTEEICRRIDESYQLAKK